MASETIPKWRDVSVEYKFLVAFLIIILFVGANVGSVYLVIQAQEDTAQAINTAGKQRMLVKQMVIEADRIAHGETEQKEALTRSANTYDRNLADLQSGNASRGLPSPPSGVRSQLEVVSNEWVPFRASVQTLVTQPRDSQEFQTAHRYVRQNQDDLLRETDEVVSRYQMDFSRTVSITFGVTLTTFVVSLLVVLSSLYGIRAEVLQPLDTLAAESRDVANEKRDGDITVRDATDEVGQLSKAIRDMKNQLRESLSNTQRFKHAVENAGVPIFFTDLDGTIQYTNSAFSRVTGYSAEEALGRDIRLLRSREHDERFYDEVWSTIVAGAVWEGEIINQRKNGKLFTAYLSISSYTDESDTRRGYMGVFRDITAQKRNRQYRTVLERVLRHNLRNELTILDGYTSRLEEAESETEIAEIQQILENEIAKLHTLVTQVSKISKILNQEGTGAPLKLLLERSREECMRIHPEARWAIEMGHETGSMVDTRLLPALTEVCENAIEHTDHDSPEVTIQTESDTPRKSWVTISIADTGPGIPETEREVIESGDETPLQHGTGLGLWLVYSSVSTVGGTVEITDNDPRGTLVSLSVPVISSGADLSDGQNI